MQNTAWIHLDSGNEAFYGSTRDSKSETILDLAAKSTDFMLKRVYNLWASFAKQNYILQNVKPMPAFASAVEN